MKLRRELLLFERSDGGIDLIDLLLEAEHHFAAEEAALLRRLEELPEAGVPLALLERIEAALLVESPGAGLLRQGARHGRVRPVVAPPPLPEAAERDGWGEAEALPECVAPAWRDPERWRRLAEERIAGRTLLRLEGFLTPSAAMELARAVAALPLVREDSMYVRGQGCTVEGPELDPVAAAFHGGPLRALIGRVMGLALPARLFLRAWRLAAGDYIATHKDGLHYVTTFSLGLCEGWTASHGGAIAFGHPFAQGLEVVERWLPHLGDLLLFRPTARAWHAVERVQRGVRCTVTGQYVDEGYPG